MRWYIIRTLLYKEWLRHLADRGGIFLAILMVAATLLLSVFRKTDTKSVGFSTGVKGWHLVWYRGPWDTYRDYFGWMLHLETHRPRDLQFHSSPHDWLARDESGEFIFEQSLAAIEVKPIADGHGKPFRYQVRFWYPGQDSSVVGSLAAWFWEETFSHFGDTPLEIETAEDQTVFPPGGCVIQIRPAGTDENGQALHKLLFTRQASSPSPLRGRGAGGEGANNGNDSNPLTPSRYPGLLPRRGEGEMRWDRSSFPNLIEMEEKRLPLSHSADERSMVATALVMFSMCFFCVYLLPALTCEERERGTLLAQALSPASPFEILVAKFLFYPAVGIGLAAVLAGIYNPVVLVRPLFWLVLVITTVGYLGVGMTIASLAHTQRMASMGALAYMLTAGLFLYITEHFGIPSVRFVALEYYCPRMLHEVMMGSVRPVMWYLLPALFLACIWSYVASVVFRKRGWQ